MTMFSKRSDIEGIFVRKTFVLVRFFYLFLYNQSEPFSSKSTSHKSIYAQVLYHLQDLKFYGALSFARTMRTTWATKLFFAAQATIKITTTTLQQWV